MVIIGRGIIMKKYLAIGHFKDSKNMTSVALKTNSVKDFRCDLQG